MQMADRPEGIMGFRAPAHITHFTPAAMQALSAMSHKIGEDQCLLACVRTTMKRSYLAEHAKDPVPRYTEQTSVRGASFDSTVTRMEQAPTPGILEAWTFTLGFLNGAGEKIAIGGEAEDLVGVQSIQTYVDELREEGVLNELKVDITGISKADDYTTRITVNVLGA